MIEHVFPDNPPAENVMQAAATLPKAPLLRNQPRRTAGAAAPARPARFHSTRTRPPLAAVRGNPQDLGPHDVLLAYPQLTAPQWLPSRAERRAQASPRPGRQASTPETRAAAAFLRTRAALQAAAVRAARHATSRVGGEED